MRCCIGRRSRMSAPPGSPSGTWCSSEPAPVSERRGAGSIRIGAGDGVRQRIEVGDGAWPTDDCRESGWAACPEAVHRTVRPCDNVRPMTRPRAVRFMLAIPLALVLLSEVRAQYPAPRVRDPFDSAFRLFDAERWLEAFEAFETARETAGTVPPEALKRWGIAAAEAGRPFAAFVRLRQYLARRPEGAVDADGVVERATRVREVLLAAAIRFCRVQMSVERRPDEASQGERHIVRVAARDGDVSLEGMSGVRNDALVWRRAEEIPMAPYVKLVARLLDSPAVTDDLPAQ